MGLGSTNGDTVIELYHNINSVCAQKVRITLKEKDQEVKEHILTLRGDQNEPAYLKLNPNGVVPTLVHDRHMPPRGTAMRRAIGLKWNAKGHSQARSRRVSWD